MPSAASLSPLRAIDALRRVFARRSSLRCVEARERVCDRALQEARPFSIVVEGPYLQKIVFEHLDYFVYLVVFHVCPSVVREIIISSRDQPGSRERITIRARECAT